MAKPEVTISVRVEDKDSEAAFVRMKARFAELDEISDKAIKNLNKDFAGKISQSFASGGEREYLETVRRISPQLKQLHENIKDGSLDLTDYQRRMALLSPITRKAIEDAQKLGSAFNNVGDEAEHGTNGLGKLLVSLNLLDRVIDFVKGKLTQAKDEFLLFGKEMSAIATIVDDGFDLSKARKEIASLPAALGKSSELANGFKLAVGSGVEAGKALQFTADSAKAAKAGFAGVTETVDASTTILNSYGIEAKRVNDVYDLMFQTVKNGKIEFPQLAQSVGQVSNIAAQSGVKLEEMFAVIATATATTKPATAIEAFRSALSNILKPSEQARDLAEQLGLQFDVAALRSKGFAGFLAEVMQKTKGNTDQLAILFGDVQGLNSILSITGAQAQNFTKNLKDMEGASGNVDAAFQKQQQSLSAQMENFGVAFEKKIGNALSVVEPLLIGIFSVINNYPTVFTAAALVVGGLTLAHLALNTQLIVGATTAIPQLLMNLKNLIGVMLSVTQVTSMSATALTAFTLGWGTIIAVIGVAAYSLYQYNQAQQKTTEEHLNGLNAVKGQIDTLNQQKQTLDSLQGNVAGLSLEQGKLADIYQTLDAASKNRVDKAVAEKGATAALREEIERLNQAKLLEVDARLTNVIADAAKAYENQEKAVRAAREAEEEYNRALREGRSDTQQEIGGYTALITAQEQFENLRDKVEKTGVAQREATEKFAGFQSILQSGAPILGLTADELVRNKVATNQVDAVSKDFINTLGRTTGAQNNFANGMNKTNGVIDQQTNAIKSLRDQLKGLTSDTRTKIDEKVAEIVLNTSDKAAAAARARDAMQNDGQLKGLLNENKRLKESQDAIEKVFGLVSENNKKLRSADLADAKKYVRGMKAELGDLQGVLDAMRKGTMMQESGGRATIQNTRTNATGLFQVMPANIPNWTKEYVGKILSVSQFKKDVDAQITVFNGEMGKYLLTAMKKSGGDVKKAIRMAAAAWYGGEGAMKRFDDPTVFRKGEPSFREYTSSVLQRTMRTSGGGKSIEVKEFDAEVRATQEIADARARINLLINEGGDANQKQLEALREYENNLKQIGNLVEKINDSGLKEHIVVALPDTPEDAKKTVERLQAFTQLQESIRSQNDNAKTRIYELNEAITDGLTDLEKFDFKLQTLRATGTLTANDFALLAGDIDDVRQALKKAAELEAAQKLQRDAKAITSSFNEMNKTFRQEIEELNLIEDIKPFTGFLNQIEQIKELDLPTDAFSEFRTAISADGVDVEKLAEIARAWLLISAAVGGTDATKIDEIVNKIKEAAKNFNQLTGSQKTTKNAEDFDSVADSLGKQLEELRRGGVELSEYEKTLRQIQDDYANLDPSQKAYLLNVAKQIDEQKAFNEQYSKTYDFIRDSFDILTEKGTSFGEKIKSIFGSIADRFKKMLMDMAASWLTNKIMGGGASGASPTSSGGGILDLFKGFFGGGNRSTPPFVGNASTSGNADLSSLFSGGGSSNSSATGAGGGMWGGWNQFANDRQALGNQLGGGKFNLGNLKNLFGKGGVFGSKGFGFNSGTIGGLGMAGGILGSLIGGTTGSVLMGAASGIGAASSLASILGMSSIGGPVGLAIGAAIGGGIALFSALFGRNKQRKANEKARTQFMNDAMAGLSGFDSIISDVRNMRLDSASGIAQGEALGRSLRDQYLAQANSLKDKKTRNIALRSVSQIDTGIGVKMSELRAAAKSADGASAIRQRAVPQFAKGGYMSPEFLAQYGDFKRRSGLLTGGIAGKDSLPSLLMPHEIVANEEHQQRARDLVGFDIWKHIGIPGYASGTYVSSTPAPVYAPQAPAPSFNSDRASSGGKTTIEITFVQNHTGIVESDIPQIMVKGLDDYEVKTKLQKTIKKEKARGERYD